MKKLQRRKILTVIIGFIIVIAMILAYTVNKYHKLYDKNKPNIFEIPGTAHVYTISSKVYFEYYFMVQKLPDDDAEIRNMLDEFIEENSEIISNSFDNGASYVFLNYMIPSTAFPVYFEEDKNYFIIDDFVTHYEKTNKVVCVKFMGRNQSGDYIFYREVIDKLK